MADCFGDNGGIDGGAGGCRWWRLLVEKLRRRKRGEGGSVWYYLRGKMKREGSDH
ncbi:hypothetical protein TIFTF001_002779 [Ficus carica]|uniref:Uncharacterized protein n=1 Tax=Ficus carica TaxID=3494 RepID=A0AA87ZEU5_FICCA|nr:hypothetical protein TIFTF001_002779 [Ficus carica]